MTYYDQIMSMADVCREDRVYIDGIKEALLKSGLASMCGLAIDEAKLDPFRPCPAHWTAFQIAYFDNGDVEKKRNRPKIQRTRVRWGGNIKVWTRDVVSFSNDKHVAWTANIHLWTAAEAQQIVRDLREEKYVGDETVQMMDELVACGDDEMRFSVPLLRIGTATRWMRSHVVISRMGDNAIPTASVIYFPDTQFATKAFSDVMPNGERYRGNAVLQARIARRNEFAPWATEVVS